MAVSMVIINLFELSKVKGNMFQKLAKLSNFQEEGIFFNSCHFQKIKKKKQESLQAGCSGRRAAVGGCCVRACCWWQHRQRAPPCSGCGRPHAPHARTRGPRGCCRVEPALSHKKISLLNYLNYTIQTMIYLLFSVTFFFGAPHDLQHSPSPW